jgi:hypothetical protein
MPMTPHHLRQLRIKLPTINNLTQVLANNRR